jgi:hypothetical protein
MLSLDPTKPEALSPGELAATLSHQLKTSVAVDLNDSTDDGTTYAQLFSSPQPSLELLQRVKQFAKLCKSQPDGPLPAEVATVLYFAAIVKAQIACGVRISALSQAQVADGVRWALDQTWIPHSIRQLIEHAR